MAVEACVVQLLVTGFVHADPHEGNLRPSLELVSCAKSLEKPRKRSIWIDFDRSFEPQRPIKLDFDGEAR